MAACCGRPQRYRQSGGFLFCELVFGGESAGGLALDHVTVWPVSRVAMWRIMASLIRFAEFGGQAFVVTGESAATDQPARWVGRAARCQLWAGPFPRGLPPKRI